MTHGAGLAALWPSWARYVYKDCLPRFVRFARNVMGVTADGTDEEVALLGIDAMVDFYHSIGMPASFHELGIAPTDAQIDEMAHRCLEACGTALDSAKKLGLDDIIAIKRDGTFMVTKIAEKTFVGKDILLEYQPDVYELLDLRMGVCRMAVAGKKDFRDPVGKTLKVATKFPNIARNYYASKCRDIDIIHLNGSIELAPILGLSHVIVDIVETGTTLKENDLAVHETIVPISARLIANVASYQFKDGEISAIRDKLEEQVKNK